LKHNRTTNKQVRPVQFNKERRW